MIDSPDKSNQDLGEIFLQAWKTARDLDTNDILESVNTILKESNDI